MASNQRSRNGNYKKEHSGSPITSQVSWKQEHSLRYVITSIKLQTANTERHQASNWELVDFKFLLVSMFKGSKQPKHMHGKESKEEAQQILEPLWRCSHRCVCIHTGENERFFYIYFGWFNVFGVCLIALPMSVWHLIITNRNFVNKNYHSSPTVKSNNPYFCWLFLDLMQYGK